ncbi:hypothetical protein [Spirosoma rhododendri]|uniref:Uncharacterized protein n=1 Tax=Spirosoma rhododendri TaxID=2728024 RepID=A0A7L5E195_9BACT|nr:hypothetical protein [Spirosoma rhododendri]QJD81520.1 hypothetical protein HH216_24420 [Spirosoma rhododendri]
MNYPANPIPAKLRQLLPTARIPAHKQPYLLQGSPDTILYLTLSQASNRRDLIAQFSAIAPC